MPSCSCPTSPCLDPGVEGDDAVREVGGLVRVALGRRSPGAVRGAAVCRTAPEQELGGPPRLPDARGPAHVQRVGHDRRGLDGPRVDRSVEMLVVDDGSPDGTGDLVAERAASEPRVRLLERGREGRPRERVPRGLSVWRSTRGTTSSWRWTRPVPPARAAAAAPGGGALAPHGDGSRSCRGARSRTGAAPPGALARGNLYARMRLGFPLHDATSGFRLYPPGAPGVTGGSPSAPTGMGSRWSHYWA